MLRPAEDGCGGIGRQHERDARHGPRRGG
jgi:hypothetical protein